MVGLIVVDYTWVLGFIASIFISMSMLPQVYKMWRLRHEELKEFHILWFIFGTLGSVLFMWYGILIGQIGLVILNIIGVTSFILMLLINAGVWRKEVIIY